MSMKMNRFLFPRPFVEDVDTSMNDHIILSTFHKKYPSFVSSRARVSTFSTDDRLCWRPVGSQRASQAAVYMAKQWSFLTGG